MTKAETVDRLQTLICQVACLPEGADVLTAEVTQHGTEISFKEGSRYVSKLYPLGAPE